MNAFEAIILGIVQGLTEFLPISSSGHLVLFQNLFGFQEPEILFDVSLHLGTLLAVIIYFRSDLMEMVKALVQRDFKNPSASLFLWVIIGCIPTAVIGLVFKDPLEGLFGSVTLVGFMLLATGIIVGLDRVIPGHHTTRMQVGLLTALAVGTAQGLAIIPGISRSGATIICGMLCGMNREMAGRFSFLLSIPAIMGAMGLQMDLEAVQRLGFAPLISGFVTATFVGILALKLLMGMIKKGHLYYFAPYVWAMGTAVIIFV
jgi:undecaprenyl-diphosphatase